MDTDKSQPKFTVKSKNELAKLIKNNIGSLLGQYPNLADDILRRASVIDNNDNKLNFRNLSNSFKKGGLIGKGGVLSLVAKNIFGKKPNQSEEETETTPTANNISAVKQGDSGVPAEEGKQSFFKETATPVKVILDDISPNAEKRMWEIFPPIFDHIFKHLFKSDEFQEILKNIESLGTGNDEPYSRGLIPTLLDYLDFLPGRRGGGSRRRRVRRRARNINRIRRQKTPPGVPAKSTPPAPSKPPVKSPAPAQTTPPTKTPPSTPPVKGAPATPTPSTPSTPPVKGTPAPPAPSTPPVKGAPATPTPSTPSTPPVKGAPATPAPSTPSTPPVKGTPVPSAPPAKGTPIPSTPSTPPVKRVPTPSTPPAKGVPKVPLAPRVPRGSSAPKGATGGIRGARGLATGAKALGVIGTVATVGLTAYEIQQIDEAEKRGEITPEEAKKMKGGAIGAGSGGLVGGLAGAAGGAALGTLIFPGVGTVIGGAIGGIIGGIGGSMAGEAIGEAVSSSDDKPQQNKPPTEQKKEQPPAPLPQVAPITPAPPVDVEQMKPPKIELPKPIDNTQTFDEIAKNTGTTNDVLQNLTRAIFKLAETKPKNNNIILGGSNQSNGFESPPASVVAQSNVDEIRRVRSKFTVA
jgi:hypothetical protein